MITFESRNFLVVLSLHSQKPKTNNLLRQTVCLAVHCSHQLLMPFEDRSSRNQSTSLKGECQSSVKIAAVQTQAIKMWKLQNTTKKRERESPLRQTYSKITFDDTYFLWRYALSKMICASTAHDTTTSAYYVIMTSSSFTVRMQ